MACLHLVMYTIHTITCFQNVKQTCARNEKKIKYGKVETMKVLIENK